MKKSLSIILILLALGVSVVAYLLARTKVTDTPQIDINAMVVDESFTDMHYATLLVDSFDKLVKTAYPGIATTQRKSTSLDITIKNTNQLGSDFYNNNDKLLKYKKADYGFEIKHDKASGTIKADFEVKGDQVVVPHDVLIRLAHNVLNKPIP